MHDRLKIRLFFSWNATDHVGTWGVMILIADSNPLSPKSLKPIHFSQWPGTNCNTDIVQSPRLTSPGVGQTDAGFMKWWTHHHIGKSDTTHADPLREDVQNPHFTKTFTHLVPKSSPWWCILITRGKWILSEFVNEFQQTHLHCFWICSCQ